MSTAVQSILSKPRRRWLQFSLRTMMLVVLIVSMSLGWLGMKASQARRQREAVATIEGLGGFAVYDFAADSDCLPLAFPESPGPAWLRYLLGEDAVGSIVTVGIRADVVEELDQKSTDQLFDRLLDFAQVRCLYLNGSLVGDAALERLTMLPQLQHLHLGSTPVTDAGLVHLQRLAQLKSLNLAYTRVTDAGVVRLRELTQLEDLNLSGTQVTEACEAELQRALPRLGIGIARAGRPGAVQSAAQPRDL